MDRVLQLISSLEIVRGWICYYNIYLNTDVFWSIHELKLNEKVGNCSSNTQHPCHLYLPKSEFLDSKSPIAWQNSIFYFLSHLPSSYMVKAQNAQYKIQTKKQNLKITSWIKIFLEVDEYFVPSYGPSVRLPRHFPCD